MKNILYTKQGAWKLYHDAKLGICFYEPGATTPMILFEKGMADFDADCDADGCIYVLCQDDKNNLYLFWFDKRKWNKQCILESKSAVPYDKNFSVVCVNGWVNAFYTIRHGERTLLIHHVLNNEGEPQVIETSDKPLLYTVITDSRHNIYCIYDKDGIGYQVYNWNIKKWQRFSVLHPLSGELKSVCAVTDRNDMLHLVCCCREKQDYAVYYISRSGVQEILSGLAANPEPVILYYDAFYILFRLNGRLLQSTSKDPEEGFLKPAYYFPGSFSPHDLFRISSAVDLKQNRIFAKIIYGSELRADRFEPAIIGDAIKEIDYSVPKVATEQKPEIEDFVQQSLPFEEEMPASQSMPNLPDLERRVAELEKQMAKLLQEKS